MERVPLKNGKLLVVREAEPEDSAALIAFSKIVGRETDFLNTDESGWQVTAEEEAEKLAASLINPRQGTFLALVDSEIAGMFSVNPFSTRQRIRHNAVFGIALRESCWHLGIGSVAMTLAVDMAREWGYHKLMLEARADNARALALYRRFGFTECGRRREHMCIRGQYYDEILMELML